MNTTEQFDVSNTSDKIQDKCYFNYILYMYMYILTFYVWSLLKA